MNEETTLTVAQLTTRIREAVVSSLPAPVWVRGEVVGFKRTSGGAAYFRLADAETDGNSIGVSARGRMMMDVDHALEQAGVGRLREGVEVRIRGTVGFDLRRSFVNMSLLGVDPAFTAGRMATDRAALLRRLVADGTAARNGRLALPRVPTSIGLVTSRGTAAHADFLEHLKASGIAFRVKVANVRVQGEAAAESISRGLDRLASEEVDAVVVIRGGGSRLDLAPYDSELVARGIARMPVPVVVGVGHEIDRSVADEVAAISVKTPTAAAELMVGMVKEYLGRLDRARSAIQEEASSALSRAGAGLESYASRFRTARESIGRHADRLDELSRSIGGAARIGIDRRRAELGSLTEMIEGLGLVATLSRGFAVASDGDGATIRSVLAVSSGERISVRVSDGSFQAVVDGHD